MISSPQLYVCIYQCKCKYLIFYLTFLQKMCFSHTYVPMWSPGCLFVLVLPLLWQPAIVIYDKKGYLLLDDGFARNAFSSVYFITVLQLNFAFQKARLLAQNKIVMSTDSEKHLWKNKGDLDLFHLASEIITPSHSTALSSKGITEWRFYSTRGLQFLLLLFWLLGRQCGKC